MRINDLFEAISIRLGGDSGRRPRIKEAEEYAGQNKFLRDLQKNPRSVARHAAAIRKLRSAFIKACSEVGVQKIHGASLNILGNYPHSDSSVATIEERIGRPDWDNCDHDPQSAYDFALTILDDAIDHPIEWDCISGMAMKHILCRYNPFYS